MLRHTFFLGVMLRVELELPSGLIIRARMTKEEYAHLGLEDGQEVSFQIRQYRVLAREAAALPPESESSGTRHRLCSGRIFKARPPGQTPTFDRLP